MSSQNELAVSPEEMAAAASAMVSEDAAIETVVNNEPAPELQETVEVEDPAGFWDNDDLVATEAAGTDEQSAASEVSQDSASGTITFKAHGKDVTLTVDEAKKRLSLSEGGRQAFSDLDKTKKQAKALETEVEGLKPYKQSWERLESIKHDKAKVYQVITGESFDDFVNAEIARRETYAAASPEQREALDLRAEIERDRADRAHERKLREKEDTDRDQRDFNSEKRELSMKMEREFAKYLPKSGDPQVDARMRKMLWRNAAAELKEYHTQGIEISEKAISRAFKDTAGALNLHQEQAVAAKVKEVTASKKQAAKEKAQIASTRNYSDGKISKDLVKKNPLDVFRHFQRGLRS